MVYVTVAVLDVHQSRVTRLCHIEEVSQETLKRYCEMIELFVEPGGSHNFGVREISIDGQAEGLQQAVITYRTERSVLQEIV